MSADIFSKTISEWASEAASLSVENKLLQGMVERLEEEAARLRDELGRAQAAAARVRLASSASYPLTYAELDDAKKTLRAIANHPVVARCGSVLGGKSAQDLAREYLEK